MTAMLSPITLMPLHCAIYNFRRRFVFLIFIILPILGNLTRAQSRLDYSQPALHLPDPFAPYIPRYVPDPVLVNTPRIDSLLQDGKLMLSLDDAVTLALENNLDLAIARYNLS